MCQGNKTGFCRVRMHEKAPCSAARKSLDIYEPRNLRKTHYFRCVQNHFENLEMALDDRYQNEYGFFRRAATRRKRPGGRFSPGSICAAPKRGHAHRFCHRKHDESRRWRDGFSVYCGKTLWPDNEEGLENLARYIIRASFSSERMTPYRSTGQAKYPGI